MVAILVRRCLILWFVLVGFLHSAPAATITVTNFDGPRSNLLSRDDGTILTSGLVWLGTFTIDNAGIRKAFADRDLVLLEESFQQFGRSASIGFNGLPVLYQDVVTQAVAEGDTFAGQNVYTVISNQGLLHDADHLLIFQHDQVFLTDPNRNDPALLNDEEGELLVGEFGRFLGSIGQIEDQPMFTLARTIPEPSSTMLLVISLSLIMSRSAFYKYDSIHVSSLT